MSVRVFLCIAAAAALTLGAAPYAAPPAEAGGGLVIEAGGKGHYWGKHRRKPHKPHYARKHHHKLGYLLRRGPNYPPGCRWKRRYFRVRDHDPYHGWYTKTVSRPIYICP